MDLVEVSMLYRMRMIAVRAINRGQDRLYGNAKPTKERGIAQQG